MNSPNLAGASGNRLERETIVVRFAGDSGDGIQIVGGQLGLASALGGNDLATFPDYPSEVRAPAGSTFGVSAYQIHFGGRPIKTVGDEPDMLVALNPAALKTNLPLLRKGGIVLVDIGSFTKRNLQKAGYETSPLEDENLKDYQVFSPDISRLTLESVAAIDLSKKESLRSKNFWALGMVFWMFDRSLEHTCDWLRAKFAKTPLLADGNIAALKAGHAFGETIEASGDIAGYVVPPVAMEPGVYRSVTGSETIAWGLAAAAELAERQLVFASYPITPSTPVLHHLAKLKDLGVVTFQAEDEIAAIGAAIGAAWAGAFGVTASSGPGIALKQEAIALAVSAELPVVVVNTQRAGPSTGLPTKAEQSDLYQAVFGRHGDTPIPVLAARSPQDCFDCAIDAARIALTFMTPVILLTDGFIANASGPWQVPDMDALPRINVRNHIETEGFHPMQRDPDTLARVWPVPGTPGLEHRIGGVEKDSETGHISYDPKNHQKMTDIRSQKIDVISQRLAPLEIDLGEEGADVAVVTWGSTYGPASRAVTEMQANGHSVAHVHLRYLYPFASNQHELMSTFKRILVPEMNTGQLITLMRNQLCPPATGLSKVTGRPFLVREIRAAILAELEAVK